MAASGDDAAFPAGTGYATGLAIGVGTGVALGTALGNLALGIAIGAGIGLALGVAFERGRETEPLTPGQRRLLVFALALGLLVGLAVLALALLG
jgi:hypothetical protein